MSVIEQTLKTASIPAYVLDAPLDQLGVDQYIADSAYAWSHNDQRKFPCHTKAACFISRLYFDTQRSKMDSKQAEIVDANLTKLAAIHGLGDDDLASAVSTIKAAQSPRPTPQQLANSTYMLTVRDPESMPPDRLIQAARELKQAGAEGLIIDRWAFDRPLKNLNGLRAIAKNLQSEKLAGLVDEMQSQSPRRWAGAIPAVAAAIYSSVNSTTVTQRKLAALPTQDDPDIRILGRNIPVGKVKPVLRKIAMLTDAEVYYSPLQIPRKDWPEKLEALPVEKQRQIVEMIV